jgi:hypothetical protein
MTEALPVVQQMLQARDFSDEPAVRSLVEAALERFGESVQAVVLYGSFTRGARDTLLDLYVLLEDLDSLPAWQRVLGWMLAPNVYQLVTDESRAKVAVMTFAALEKGVRSDIAPYFWARFAQPCALVYSRDDSVPERFARLVTSAATRLVAAVDANAPADTDASAEAGVPGARDSESFWEHTFSLTYAAELRPERSTRYLALYNANADYFDAIHGEFAGLAQPPQTSWRVRRMAGKWLALLRILKSALTFDDPVDYALWKVQRHSGVEVTATDRQRRYPLIFGWGLAWRLYRQGMLK